MFGRMEPGTPEWGRALDAHLQPPDYDGCEDCECEDPEHPEGHYTTYTDPVSGETCSDEWVTCDCKCHNIPHDPRDDRPEPDDIPDYWDAPDYNDREREEH